MTPPDDLKQQFAALREQDGHDAPPFAGTLAAARARRQPLGSVSWGWIAIAGAAVVATIAVTIHLAEPGISTPGEPGALTGAVDQWVAPTDELLASAEPLASQDAMFGDTADDIAFFSSPTADLLDLVEDPIVRTP